MAAVTSIVNPLNKDNFLLFYCNSQQYVNLNRDPTSNAQQEKDQPKKTGPIRNPSCFTAVVWKRLLYVFGIREEDDAICSVSPEFRAIRAGPNTITTYQGILAGCSDGTSGWLYYLSKPKDDSPISIMEFSLDPPSYNEYDPGDDKPVDATNLVAYYSPDSTPERYCIFQAGTGIRWTRFPDNDSGFVKETKNVKDLTPMALAIARNVAYLFFINGDERLVWTSKQPGHEWKQQIQDTPIKDIMDGSKISAVTHPDQDAIFVFYIPKRGTEEFVSWRFTPSAL